MKEATMEDAFILYKSEIDALRSEGHEDILRALKEASAKNPNASFQEVLDTVSAGFNLSSTNETSVEEALLEETVIEPVVLEVEESVVLDENLDSAFESLTTETTSTEPEDTITTSYTDDSIQDEKPFMPTTEVIVDESLPPVQVPAPAGSGFEILEDKFAHEYKSDIVKPKDLEEPTEEKVEVKKDYSRKEATGFTLDSDADIEIGHKEYVPPVELVVDMSVEAPNLAPVPDEIVEEGFGVETDIQIGHKDYAPPSELVVDNSMIAEEVESDIVEPVIEEKKGFRLFGKKRLPERPIPYLPPKEIIIEENKNPQLELEEPIVSKKDKKLDNKIVNEASIPSRPNVEFLTPQNAFQSEESEDDKSTVKPNFEVDYEQLAAELAAEKQAEAQETYTDSRFYDNVQDTESSNETYIEESELTEEQRRMALRFPERPNVNTRQIIKDVKSIDTV